MMITKSFILDDEGQVIKTRVRNQRNYVPSIDNDLEEPAPNNEHVPNMVLSMREILTRYQRGESLTANGGFYDETLPDFSRMSKTDLIDLARENQQSINKFQSEQQDLKVKSELAKQAEIAEKLKRLEDLEKTPKPE